MPMSGIAIPTDVTVADQFESKADDFAALAEAAATLDDCLRYRDLEHSYRMRAEEERARQIAHFRSASNDNGQAAA